MQVYPNWTPPGYYVRPVSVEVTDNRRSMLWGLLALVAIILLIWWLAKMMSGPSVNAQFTNTGANFTFRGQGPFYCTLDGGEEMPCTSPLQLGNLSPGQHTLQVRVGNKTVTKTWTVAA